jgi:putative flippase GtrA
MEILGHFRAIFLMILPTNIVKNQSLLEIIKFAFIGGLNTVIDFAVLNALIFLFGVGEKGQFYVIFKAISFLVAVANSYLFNKRWVFTEDTKTSKVLEKFLFFIVSGIGFLLNVSISTGVFTFVTYKFSVGHNFAANIGALCGSAFLFIWNFAGYKLIVFKNLKD